MQDRSSKRSCDPNQLGKLVIGSASGEQDGPLLTSDGKNLAAVMLGRRGGLKGGAARALSLSADDRKRIAKQAACARWAKRDANGE